MAFKILSKKNGKRVISDDKNIETTKVTKVLQFLTNTEPRDAKIGAIVRFMSNPGNGSTLYWLQGEIDKRVDKYNRSRDKDWSTNRIRVKDLKVINYWGEDCPETLPETVVVNLKRKTTWSLGTGVLLDKSEENEALWVELSDIPIECEDDDNETADDMSVKDDEGASGRVKIIPNAIESDSESLARVKLANDNPEDKTSDNMSSVTDDNNEVRRLRTSHINEWLTDERVQEIMVNVQTVIKQGARDSKADAIVAIGDTLIGAQQVMDLAFAAGTLTTPAGVTREDSSRYAERHSIEDT